MRLFLTALLLLSAAAVVVNSQGSCAACTPCCSCSHVLPLCWHALSFFVAFVVLPTASSEFRSLADRGRVLLSFSLFSLPPDTASCTANITYVLDTETPSSEVIVQGTWLTSSSIAGYYGTNYYFCQGASHSETTFIQFNPVLPEDGLSLRTKGRPFFFFFFFFLSRFYI